MSATKGSGNGFSALTSPARREGSEGLSGKPNGLWNTVTLAPKQQAGNFDPAVDALETVRP